VPYYEFIWTDALVDHVTEHGVSLDEFEHVVCSPSSKGYSHSSGLPAAWGYTPEGRYLMAVYEQLDLVTLLPVTAYEVHEPR